MLAIERRGNWLDITTDKGLDTILIKDNYKELVNKLVSIATGIKNIVVTKIKNWDENTLHIYVEGAAEPISVSVTNLNINAELLESSLNKSNEATLNNLAMAITKADLPTALV